MFIISLTGMDYYTCVAVVGGGLVVVKFEEKK